MREEGERFVKEFDRRTTAMMVRVMIVGLIMSFDKVQRAALSVYSDLGMVFGRGEYSRHTKNKEEILYDNM